MVSFLTGGGNNGGGSGTTNVSNNNSLPWVEKYRPKSMDEIASQADVISVLKNTFDSNNLPHMLFYGPPGTGKTSTILALARDLFGPQLFKSRILELNASDERGIDVVREKVKNFAKTTVTSATNTIDSINNNNEKYPCPPFKLIILDEADSLTADAQTALRRIMELYSKGTRFCIICNYVSRIIGPLTSRCAKFRFKPVEPDAGIARLEFISKMEDVKFNLSDHQEQERKRVLQFLLVNIAGGDLRRAITLLQGVHKFGEPISIELLSEVGGIIPNDLIDEAYNLCLDQAPMEMVDFVQKNVIRRAHSVQQFIKQFLIKIINDPTISAIKKSMITLCLSKVDYSLTDGADEMIQLLSLMTYCQELMSSKDRSIEVSAF